MTDYKGRILDGLIETLDGRAQSSVPVRAIRRPRRVMTIALGTCAAVAALGLLVARDEGGGIDVVAKAAAAISPQSDEILHYRLDGVGIESRFQEVWQTAGPPRRVRSRAEGTNRSDRPCIFELSWVFDRTGRFATTTAWDDARNVVQTGRGLRSRSVFPDPFAELRRHLSEGDLQEAGRATVNGREAVLLTPRKTAGLPAGGRFGDLTKGSAYYVDATTYRPLRWVIGRTPEQYYDVPVFEYLPTSPENRGLLSVKSAHPGAFTPREVPRPYRDGCAGG